MITRKTGLGRRQYYNTGVGRRQYYNTGVGTRQYYNTGLGRRQFNWSRKTTELQYFRVFDVVTKQIILLDNY